MVKKDQVHAIAVMKKKKNFEGLNENECFGNQPQPFEVLLYNTDANSSCSFAKQDLIFKQLKHIL